MKKQFAKWYVIAWRLIWGLPVWVTRILFVGFIGLSYGKHAMKDMWYYTC